MENLDPTGSKPTAYWSAADDDPPTYHTYENCPWGQQILPENLRKGTPPLGWGKCGVCMGFEKRRGCR